MGHPSFINKGQFQIGFNRWFNPSQQRQSSISHSKVENAKIHDVVFRGCDLNNVAIEDCNIKGLTINGVEIEALLSTYYSRSNQPFNNLTREL